MNRALRIAIVLVVGLVLLLAVILFSQRSRSRGALAAYKLKLRAQGEKLSFEEMGFPRKPDTNDTLPDFLAAVNALPPSKLHPGGLELMHYAAAGQVQPAGKAASPSMKPWSTGSTNAPSWQELDALLLSASNALADIRYAVREPPRMFLSDPANFANAPRYPFVQQRTAAQWLAADVVVALRAGELARAQEDLHALTQLAQFFKDDFTLVAQMIRVAVSGVALAATWEALQAPGWDETGLAALQRDLEELNLQGTFEHGMRGERAFGESAFASARTNSSRQTISMFRLSSGSSPRKPEDYFKEWVLVPLWRANMDADELFYLEHHQRCLDSMRRLQSGTPWVTIDAEFKSHHAMLEGMFTNKLASYRYMFSAIAIPNTARAGNNVTRAETQGRLTVAAIAIERYRLQHARPPENLAALVPQFLSAVPIDPMNSQPLGYRRESDGSFTLYSTGEDSRDDGGNAALAVATNKFELWTGKDAVWPKAVAATTNSAN